MTGFRLTAVALSCATAVLGLAACGSDGGSTTTSSGSAAATPTTTQAAAGAGGFSQQAIDFGLKYTGGTAGKADPSLKPLTIGFTSQNGGTPSFPEHPAAAAAVVKLINDQLGGIGGHALKLDECTIQTEEDGQKCAAQLIGDGVPLINNSLIVVGNTSLAKTVNQKVPVLHSITPGSADITTKGAYSYNGGGFALLGAMADDLVKNGAKNIASLTVGNPGGKFSWEDQTKPKLDKLGVKYKNVYFDDAATTPDMVSALQAAGGTSADAIYLNPSGPANCVALWDAMKQLNITKPVATTPICLSPVFIDHTGGAPVNWRFWGFGINPRVASDQWVQNYLNIMKAGGAEKYQYAGFADATVRDILTLDKLATQIGFDKITPAAFDAAIRAYRGPIPGVPGVQNCESPPDPKFPGLCGNTSVGSAFQDGKWVSLGGIVYTPLT